MHMLVLGGEDQFAISTFPDLHSVKVLLERGATEQKANKHIITLDMFKAADQISKYREPPAQRSNIFC